MGSDGIQEALFSATITLAKCWSLEQFKWQRVYCIQTKKIKSLCEQFALHFEDKINPLCSKLDSIILKEFELGTDSVLSSGPVVMDTIQVVQPKDVEKLFGSI